MALTKTQRRQWMARIVEIRRRLIVELQKEIGEICAKLGAGTHRSTEFPGLKFIVSRPHGYQAGHRVDWKAVAVALRGRYNVPDAVFDRIVDDHKAYSIVDGKQTPTSGWAVTIQTDRAKNPKVAAA